MSIQSEIDRIRTVKEELRQALVAKGATLTGGAMLEDFTTAVNSLPSGGGDLPEVTVTAASLRNGVTAINTAGAVITGTMPDVTPTLTGNKFTVTSGYVTESELTVPESTITESETSVTIGVGYVSEEKEYSISSGTPELPSVSFKATDLRQGVTAINSSGEVVSGAMPNAHPEKPIINFGEDGVFYVTARATSGYVAVDNREQEFTLTFAEMGMTTKSEAEYIPTTADQTISANQFLIGDQTIKGDANLIAGNIKKDVTIFGVTGSLESGSNSGESDSSSSKAKMFCATLIYR